MTAVEGRSWEGVWRQRNFASSCLQTWFGLKEIDSDSDFFFFFLEMTGPPQASCSWALQEIVFEKPWFAPEGAARFPILRRVTQWGLGWSEAEL